MKSSKNSDVKQQLQGLKQTDYHFHFSTHFLFCFEDFFLLLFCFFFFCRTKESWQRNLCLFVVHGLVCWSKSIASRPCLCCCFWFQFVHQQLITSWFKSWFKSCHCVFLINNCEAFKTMWEYFDSKKAFHPTKQNWRNSNYHPIIKEKR